MKKNQERSSFWRRSNLFVKRLVLLSITLGFFSFQVEASTQQDLVKLKEKNTSLIKILNEIKEQTSYTFLYNLEDVKKVKIVNLSKLSYQVKDLLSVSLKKTSLTYEIKDQVIILKQRLKTTSTNQQKKARTIKGVVVDATGLTMPGVSVTIKGTSLGQATDIDGKFILDVPANSKTLVISLVGMLTQELKLDKSFYNIVLEEETVKMDEVVVTGYQKIDRKLFTGSAQKLTADEVKIEGAPDITASLQGKAAGVQVSNVSSTFGAAPVITIRGNSSINGSNKPLWVIDGVELEDLVNVSADDLTSGNLNTLLSSGVAGLNPEDIASFQILKDVSATALYGAKAMNGVIVITTKQGKEGKLSVKYTGSTSIKMIPTYADFDIMDSGSEMSIYRQLADYGWVGMTTISRAENYGALGKMYDGIIKGDVKWGPNGTLNEDYLERFGRSNTNWFKELFRNDITQQHSLNFSGGSAKAKYYASVSYFNDGGYTIADNVDKYTASLRLNLKPTEDFSIGFKLSSNIRDQKVPGTKNRTFDPVAGQYRRDFDINPFAYALNTSRSMRARDDNGNLEFYRRSFAPFNIIHELNNNFVDVSVKDISFQTDLAYEITKKLNVRSAIQVRKATTNREYKIHETSNQAEAYRAAGNQSIIDANQYLFKDPANPNSNAYSILPEGGFYNSNSSSLTHYYLRNIMDWNPSLGEGHSATFMIGNELNYTDRGYTSNEGWGISYDKGNVVTTSPQLQNYLNANGQVYFFTNESRDRRVAFFSTAAYTYMGRYVGSASFRYDGSNQLGESNAARYLPSWNVSGGWNIHSESFMEEVESVNHLKLKASYGYNGVMGPGTSAALAMYSGQTLRPTDKETYIYIASLENQDLTWEKMYELNLGVEYGVLGNRISGEIGYYNRNSIDLIDNITTSGIGGAQIKLGNVGNMRSSGYEFTLNTVNVKTDNFRWSSSLNLNFHTSEITKLENFASMGEAVSNLGTALKGYSQRSLFSVRFAGLDKKGIPTFYGRDDKIVYNLNLQDRDRITEVLKYEGSIAPKSYGGFTNTFKYKNFDLNIGMVYKWGNVIRLDDAFRPFYTDYDSFSKELVNRWMVPGDEKKTTIPAILDKRTYKEINGKNAYTLYNKSTERVAKGDFIRLKDISLKYNLSPKIAKKAFLNSASLSFQASNLWLLYSDSKLNGIDPEFYSSGGVSMPVSRMYTFTLNLGF